MDLQQLSQDLISAHERRTNHLAPILRGTARTHYRTAIEEFLQMIQKAAITDARTNPGEAPILGSSRHSLEGPLAVQPAASHLTGPPPHHEQLEEG